MKRDEIVNQLKEAVMVVEFKKVNGDYRKMTCTLVEDMLPPAKKDEPLTQKKVREVNPEVVSVWDVDKKDWRGFRVANVISLVEANANSS